MQWLTKLMYGRYGTDALGFFMLILVLILDVIFTFTGWDILYLFSFLLYGVSGVSFPETSAAGTQKTRNLCRYFLRCRT